MDTLQAAMLQIARLTPDLSAETEIQEEVSHTVLHRRLAGDGGTGADQEIIEEEEVVIDQERVTVPDGQKREAARLQLLEISTSSPWYAVRYKASLALGKTREQLAAMIEIWLPEIKMRLANAPDDECDLPGDLSDLCIFSGSRQVEELLAAWEKSRKRKATAAQENDPSPGPGGIKTLWRRIRAKR